MLLVKEYISCGNDVIVICPVCYRGRICDIPSKNTHEISVRSVSDIPKHLVTAILKCPSCGKKIMIAFSNNIIE